MKYFKALMLAAAALALAPAAHGAPPNSRTLHVSMSPLPGVAAETQFRKIGDAVKVVQPGDTVLIHTGVYREEVRIGVSGTKDRPITFAAAPAANVVVTGADRVSGWKREAGPDAIYSAPWPYHFIDWDPHHTHPEDEYHRVIGRAEQVFASGYLLHHVLTRDQMSRGSFYVDLDAKRLYAWRADGGDISADDPTIEAATRVEVWHIDGAYVNVRGIRFRYGASAAQQGAFRMTGAFDTATDCVIEKMNAAGASFSGPDETVTRCVFRDNGQLGLRADTTHRLHLTGCTIENNNTKGFSRGWEAGGDKISLSRGVVIDHCRFINNRGIGIWFDIGNEDCDVHNCLIADNEDAGIFYEISYGLHAHDNVIVGNGLADSPGAWGAAAGICLSSSPNCVIERNLLVGNKEGFNFREAGRTTPRIDGKEGAKEEWVWNHDQTIRHNVLADNRDAQTWGWFDVWDERQWPASMQINNRRERPSYIPEADFAKGYQANVDKGAPTGLTLDKLNIAFTANLYDTPDGQGLFRWGTAWLRHQYYDKDLSGAQKDLGFEQGSLVSPFLFGDYLTRDFRVPANSPARKLGAYPTGTIPDVQLGELLRGK